MKTVSIAITAAVFSCLATSLVRADHVPALLSPKLASIQTSKSCAQNTDARDLARERGQLLVGKGYDRQPLAVASRGTTDPNLTAGLVHTGKHPRNPVSSERFQLAPIKGK